MNVDNLYTVHRYLNQVCSDSGIKTELLISEDDLRVVLLPKSFPGIIKKLRQAAIANGIISESRNISSGTIAIITSNPKCNMTSVIDSVEKQYGGFYRDLNEAFNKDNDEKEDKSDDWEPDEDEPPRAKDRFFEDHKTMLDRRINEALDGMAIPDGAAQPKIGVKMLEQALAARTKSGMSLKEALKKAGVTWHVAEPGSHVVVFVNKNGDEKWRVEPMTLSDKKVFEDTMEALWSVALGKAPNAKELERDAAKQKAKELSDHKNEISGLVDHIIGKHTKTGQEEM